MQLKFKFEVKKAMSETSEYLEKENTLTFSDTTSDAGKESLKNESLFNRLDWCTSEIIPPLKTHQSEKLPQYEMLIEDQIPS